MTLLALSTITIIYFYFQNADLKQSLQALKLEKVEKKQEKQYLKKDIIAQASTMPMEGQASTEYSGISASTTAKAAIESKNSAANTTKPDEVEMLASESMQKVVKSPSKEDALSTVQIERRMETVQDMAMHNHSVGEIRSEEVLDAKNNKIIGLSVEQEREHLTISSLDNLTAKLNAPQKNINGPSLPVAIPSTDAKINRTAFISVLPTLSVGYLQTDGVQETALTELIDEEYGDVGFGLDVLYRLSAQSAHCFWKYRYRIEVE